MNIRMHIIKNILTYIIISFVIIYGCNKNSDPTSSDNKSNSVQEFNDHVVISGNISNYNVFFSKVYVLTGTESDLSSKIEANIDSVGYFKLSIPNPSDNLLHQYSPYNNVIATNNDTTMFIDSIKFGNPGVKFKRYDIAAYNDGGNRVPYSMSINEAEFTINSQGAKEGDYFVSYFYFNAPVNINGYYKIRYITPDSTYEFITTYNLQTKKGWNKVLTKYVGRKYRVILYEISGVNLSDDKGKWTIGASSYFLNYMPRL